MTTPLPVIHPPKSKAAMKRLARQILHELAGEYVGLAPEDFEDAWQESVDALTRAGTLEVDHTGRIARAE